MRRAATSQNAIIAILLALLIAGPADAARKWITGRDIRNGTITLRDLAPGVRAQLERRELQAAGTVNGIDFRPYGTDAGQLYGLGAYTSYGLAEWYVGATGQPGGLGVRSWHPNGNPDAGAFLYARDAPDVHNLALDYRSEARPTLLSESQHPLRIETASGRVDVGGYLVLRNHAALPSSAPVGALAMVSGTLYVRGAGGWVRP